LGWKDNRGWLVFFGDTSRNINLKLHIYYSLVDDLIGRGIYPEYISMKFPDAPFYRLADSEAVDPTIAETE
jgi:hypothetical protein